MPASTIIVQHRDGSPATRVKVSLGFESFGGVTGDAFTDGHGVAVVEHSSVGRAKVFVSGSNRGSFHAPGKFAVTI